MAQLLDGGSEPTADSLTNFFDVPPTQTVVESSYWHAARPVNTLTNEGPYKFVLPAGPDYTHLAKNYLYLKFRVLNEDGTNIKEDETDNVGTINAIGKTLFKQVKVHLNGKLTYDSGDLYAYRAYLETELNFGWDYKNTTAHAFLYYKDTGSVDGADNTGWDKRCQQTKTSAEVETMAPIHCDLFAADKFLISNVQLMLELYRNSDEFSLMSFGAKKYKIEVIDMIWYVKRLQLLSSVHLGAESALMRMPAKYPVRRVVMTDLHISSGRKTTPTTSIFDGQTPRRMIIGFVEPKAMFGEKGKSPFKFGNNGVQQIAVHAGGQIIPREPLKMDFSTENYVRAFVQLNEVLGMTDENKGNWITKDDFYNRTCLFAFDLTPAQTAESSSWELVRQGSVSVHAEFEESIKGDGLEMIVYAEFDGLCMIDRNRNVYFDYSV